MENTQIKKFSFFLNEIQKVPRFPKKDSNLRSSFENLINEFSLVRNNTKKTALTNAPYFNIFDLLGVSRDEVRTHSSMLADLLTPNGRHGQGLLFLDSFIQMCIKKDPENLTFRQYLTSHKNDLCSVLSEYHTPYGRMDIVIINPSIGFLCVIENKIDSYEQSHQLERYAQWITSMKQDYPYNALIFLTIKGYASGSSGVNRYLPLSYHKDIFQWLSNNLSFIQAPVVHNTLLQYCDIVQRL